MCCENYKEEWGHPCEEWVLTANGDKYRTVVEGFHLLVEPLKGGCRWMVFENDKILVHRQTMVKLGKAVRQCERWLENHYGISIDRNIR